MSMRSFARIQDGIVSEVFTTQEDIATLFNASLVWVDVTSTPEVSECWLYDGKRFAPPRTLPNPEGPSLAELNAQIRSLTAQIAALGPRD